MHFSLLESISKLCDEDVRLLNGPAHGLGQQKQAPALCTLCTMQKVPAAQLLHTGISWPPVHGYLVHIFDDVLKPLVFDIGGQVPDLVERFAEAVGRFMEDIGPLRENVVGGQCTVVGFELDAHLELVEIAAGLKMGKDLFV